MRIDGTGSRARSLRGGVLGAGTVIALVAGWGVSPAGHAEASATVSAYVGQSTSDDPCRYATAEAIGKAFGRPMKGSKLANICQYQGAGADVVVVKVATGPEGTILRHLKGASAQNQKGAEKVATALGEAYFDSILPVFVGRVGNHEVQIETTIQPPPRDAMIAVGKSIMESLARK